MKTFWLSGKASYHFQPAWLSLMFLRLYICKALWALDSASFPPSLEDLFKVPVERPWPLDTECTQEKKRKNYLASWSAGPIWNHDLWLYTAYICSSALWRQGASHHCSLEVGFYMQLPSKASCTLWLSHRLFYVSLSVKNIQYVAVMVTLVVLFSVTE